MSSSTVITNIAALVTNDPSLGDHSPLGLVRDAAVAVEGDRVVWTGESSKAPATDNRVDAGGRAVLPGFVDSHSHLLFGGDRTEEFNARMSGRRYSAGAVSYTAAPMRPRRSRTASGR
ncbi:amidohydrolase family protein, partial [Streptomyces olivaceus]